MSSPIHACGFTSQRHSEMCFISSCSRVPADSGVTNCCGCPAVAARRCKVCVTLLLLLARDPAVWMHPACPGQPCSSPTDSTWCGRATEGKGMGQLGASGHVGSEARPVLAAHLPFLAGPLFPTSFLMKGRDSGFLSAEGNHLPVLHSP